MSKIRTATISGLTVFVLALAVYLVALPHSVRAAQSGAVTCPITSVSSFSVQQLKDMLNARYAYRVGLPR